MEAAEQSIPRQRSLRWAIAGTFLLFFSFCIGIALTRAPWYDEGFLANPPYSLDTTGHPGVSIIDDSGPFIPATHLEPVKGIRTRMYLEMPIHTIALAAWFKVFGFSLLSGRLFTVLCGACVLFSWYTIVGRLTSDWVVAAAALFLLAGDYGFVLRASEIRMDALSAAFGFGGLALYLKLRERSFSWAIFWSHLCIAASGLTHPNGGLLSLAGLVFLTLYYDWSRIAVRHFLIAFGPYLIGAIGWGWYIAQDVESFKSQFIMNAQFGGRLETFSAPLLNIKREILLRYLSVLGGLGDSSILSKLKLFIVLVYFAGVVGVLSIEALRRQKGYRALLLLTGIYFLVLAFTDGRKSQTYVVHVIPLFTALAAATAVYLWRKRVPALRAVIAAATGILMLIHTGGTAYQVRNNSYHRQYLPAISFLKQNLRDDQLLIGPGVLGIGLKYPPNLMDDFRLGALNGKLPDWIVINEWYENWFLGLKASEPPTYAFVRNRLANEFTTVYNQGGFIIYRRNQAPSAH